MLLGWVPVYASLYTAPPSAPVFNEVSQVDTYSGVSSELDDANRIRLEIIRQGRKYRKIDQPTDIFLPQNELFRKVLIFSLYCSYIFSLPKTFKA